MALSSVYSVALGVGGRELQDNLLPLTGAQRMLCGLGIHENVLPHT